MTRIPHINIGIFGLGTVGGSVYQLLQKNKDFIQKKLGYPIIVKRVCDPDQKKQALLGIPDKVFTTKSSDILDDPEISIIVELIGDRPIAKEIMLKAMSLGKHVVTANKAILAAHGQKLYSEAHKYNVDILFEAAVGGAIPVLRSLRETFVADKIQSIYGIVNGTANYILSGMADKGLDFKDVLKEAQKMGFAEANPTSDLEGLDSNHKLAILVAMGYGVFIDPQKIPTEGISQITKFDIDMADKLGYSIKLLAISQKHKEGIEARVHPTLLPKKHLLSSVKEAYNAILINGKFSGNSILYGLGAGGNPTANAVVGDIVEISRTLATQTPGVPPLGYPITSMEEGNLIPINDLAISYYLRIHAVDEPGVLAKISNILAKHGVSILTVDQHGSEKGAKKSLPIVLLTHKVLEKKMMAALKEIDKQSVVAKKTLLIRIKES